METREYCFLELNPRLQVCMGRRRACVGLGACVRVWLVSGWMPVQMSLHTDCLDSNLTLARCPQVGNPVPEWISNVNLPAAQLMIGMGVPLNHIPDLRRLHGQVRARGWQPGELQLLCHNCSSHCCAATFRPAAGGR